MGRDSKAPPAGGDSSSPLSQADKFRDLARQLEADEDPAHFEETLKKIATKRQSDESDPK